MTTQDGYDWPNGQHDEQCWSPTAAQPMAPYFRASMAGVEVRERRCVLADCACVRYAGGPRASCGYLDT